MKIFSRYILLIIAAAVSFFFSCKKDLQPKPYWETSLLVPIAKSDLSLGNIVGDTLIKTNSDSSLQLVYESTIYSLKPGDGAFQIPDTAIKGNYNLSV